MDQGERCARREMVAAGRLMSRRGLIAGTAGNLSCRLPAGLILATPSGVAKGCLDADDLVVVDPEGTMVRGEGAPSSEIHTHLAVYRARADVGAVVHGHPPAVVAHSLAGISLAAPCTPETVVAVGDIAEVEYRPPGTLALAESIGRAAAHHDAVVMIRHGTLTLGPDLARAYHRLEVLEHLARTLVMARFLGRVEPLPEDEAARLAAEAETTVTAETTPARLSACEGSVEAIAEEVVRRLKVEGWV